jgi:hypothetical protein
MSDDEWESEGWLREVRIEDGTLRRREQRYINIEFIRIESAE